MDVDLARLAGHRQEQFQVGQLVVRPNVLPAQRRVAVGASVRDGGRQVREVRGREVVGVQVGGGVQPLALLAVESAPWISYPSAEP